MSGTPKKTVDEEILSRLQVLEVLLMEQRKEIDCLRNTLQREFDYIDFGISHQQKTKETCPKCGGSGLPEFINENNCIMCKGSGVI